MRDFGDTIYCFSTAKIGKIIGTYRIECEAFYNLAPGYFTGMTRQGKFFSVQTAVKWLASPIFITQRRGVMERTSSSLSKHHVLFPSNLHMHVLENDEKGT